MNATPTTAGTEFAAGERHVLEHPLAFILAGSAIFTAENSATGGRFTFLVEWPEARNEGDERPPHFVGVLTGPDNVHDYTYIGTIFDKRTFRHTKRSPLAKDAPSVKAFDWLFPRVVAGANLGTVTLYHEGKCGRCGRTLTVPSSVKSGFGPECIKKALG